MSAKPEGLWVRPPEALRLAEAEAHLWRVSLGMGFPARLESGVSLDELERAGRFRLEEHRRRYLLGSYALREILSRYIGMTPGAIPIRASATGKPFLREEDVGQRVSFSLSHAAGRAVVAVAKVRVGVDVEEAVDDYPYMDVAEGYFAEGEVKALMREKDLKKRVMLFFSYWTRKEALLKASGEGLHGDLKGVDFSTGGARALYRGTEWTVVELEPEGRLLCCLVAEGGLAGVEFYDWEPLKKV